MFITSEYPLSILVNTLLQIWGLNPLKINLKIINKVSKGIFLSRFRGVLLRYGTQHIRFKAVRNLDQSESRYKPVCNE